MMKRWWMLAVLMTLALSLTSCSTRKSLGQTQGSNYGYTFCQGTMGSFDVYTIPSQGDPSVYEISIIPVQLDAPGDIVKITVANQDLSYKELQSQLTIDPGVEINAGSLTENDLTVYTILAITPFTATANFLDANSEKETLCQIPQPGSDGSGN